MSGAAFGPGLRNVWDTGFVVSVITIVKVRFLSPIYHLNVCPATGHVCLGFLSEATWLPTRCVQNVLSALFALLIRPEPEIAADQTLLNMYNQNRTIYEEKARKSAQEAK